MTFGYSKALRDQLDTGGPRKARTLVEITLPSRTLRWQVGATTDYEYDGNTWLADSPAARIEPARMLNDRDLLEITLADPQGIQRNIFHAAGILNRPIQLRSVEEVTGETLEQYKGYLTGMAARGPSLVLRCSGPFAKAGARHGKYASKSFQEDVARVAGVEDKCMEQVADVRDIGWYKA